MANEVETYLTAYNEAESLAANLGRIADSIERVALALRRGSRSIHLEVPRDWPSAEQIRNLVLELDAAKDRVRHLWKSIPDDMRSRLPKPDRVGRTDAEVSLAED